MRGDNAVIKPEQRIVLGRPALELCRLFLEVVKSCAGELPGCKRFEERPLVDDLAPRAVHQDGIGVHAGEARPVDEVMRLRRVGAQYLDSSPIREQLIQDCSEECRGSFGTITLLQSCLPLMGDPVR